VAKIHPIHIINKKEKGKKIVMLTAYDYSMAGLLNESEVDIILVGDSLGNVFSGHENTIPVTLSDMIYHTKAVSRAGGEALVVADMPYLSFNISKAETRLNAGRLIKEGGAQAVKMEAINKSSIGHIKAVVDMGIPVMAHIGFTPQSVYQLGGYRVQGKSEESKKALAALATQLENAGCFSVVLEMVPIQLATDISKALRIPTIGIGAGPNCDGQVLVTNDLLGVTANKAPKFVKRYADLNQTIGKAIQQFKSDVSDGKFPLNEHGFV
jgi:3-methyl-2-oxobutanoate hydroxymethyltransferase